MSLDDISTDPPDPSGSAEPASGEDPADLGAERTVEVSGEAVPTMLNGSAQSATHRQGEHEGEAHAAINDDPFWIDVPAYQGTLGALVVKAQRGDIDLAAIPVSEITDRYRKNLASADPRPDPRQVADFLTLASRLLTLKANQLLPDSPLTGGDPEEEEPDLATEPGRRLAEYRLFKAAAEALLADAAEEGARSFLGLVAPDIVPVERLRIPPERLAAAFRAVLERIAEPDTIPVGTVTFSVADKAEALRDMLRVTARMQFEAIFEGVTSRLEAVAMFLGLLELLRNGEAKVEQSEAFGGISVSRVD